MGTRTATDLGLNLDHFEGRRPDPDSWIFLEGCQPWSMEDHASARLGFTPCPICGDLPLKGKSYCLSCDRSSLDHRVSFPGLDVDERPEPDWKPGGTAKYLYRVPAGEVKTAKVARKRSRAKAG